MSALWRNVRRYYWEMHLPPQTNATLQPPQKPWRTAAFHCAGKGADIRLHAGLRIWAVV
jgi:hypothetical protein